MRTDVLYARPLQARKPFVLRMPKVTPTLAGRLLTIIIALLGTNMIVCNVGAFVMAWQGKATPDAIVQSQGGSLTALAGFLSAFGMFYVQEKTKANLIEREKLLSGEVSSLADTASEGQRSELGG